MSLNLSYLIDDVPEKNCPLHFECSYVNFGEISLFGRKSVFLLSRHIYVLTSNVKTIINKTEVLVFLFSEIPNKVLEKISVFGTNFSVAGSAG
jgi:hypothetical protein